MLNPLIKQVPVVGQAYGFTKTAMRVYNSTSPVEAVKIAAVIDSKFSKSEKSIEFKGDFFLFNTDIKY